ncbi:MAG: hypothetical protein B7Z08_07840 [Sphingomonadales bacterium 32-68-7]|nr:MAG: hypothetical protein B7Z33_01935 [Sphingomonadales bacterium 12-68-11]OYX08885.1 MAG: hypothetical protein B7Z08_07840 [Sphingomonadales bacterium 32-68-7]
MTIGKVLAGRSPDVVQCSVGDSVLEAARQLADRRIGAMPVVAEGRVVGIFSERDVLYCIARQGETALGLRIADVMTAPAITVEPATSVLEALALMTRRRIRHLPVVEGERLAGFVSIGDLVKHRLDQIQSEAEAMRDYIRMA